MGAICQGDRWPAHGRVRQGLSNRAITHYRTVACQGVSTRQATDFNSQVLYMVDTQACERVELIIFLKYIYFLSLNLNTVNNKKYKQTRQFNQLLKRCHCEGNNNIFCSSSGESSTFFNEWKMFYWVQKRLADNKLCIIFFQQFFFVKISSLIIKYNKKG